MLPIAIVGSTTPVQVSLVNTTLPGTVVTHVPYDNVAPSIFSAQVNNNASPNSEAANGDQPEVTQTDSDSSDEQASSAPVNTAAQNQAAGAQATFLAQLMSQDGSPATQVILVQYEKLIAFGATKYKPSNAFKPAAAPANSFGQLLQQSKPVAAAQPATPSQPAARQSNPTPATSEEEGVLSSPVFNAPAPRPAPLRSANPSANNTGANSATQIINAYTQTASRVTTQELETTAELA